MEQLVRIQHTGKVLGDIELVTLNIFLPDKGYSMKSYKKSQLETNPEITDYEIKGMIKIVSEDQYKKTLVKEEQVKPVAKKAVRGPVAPTVEDALDDDNPSHERARKLLDTARTALDQLERVLTNDEVTTPASSKPQTPKKDKDDDDRLGLIHSAPAGLKPQATTHKYLKKNATGRKRFLRNCRDITMLRDIALFETDMSLKKLARQRAKAAENLAQSAQGVTQSVAK